MRSDTLLGAFSPDAPADADARSRWRMCIVPPHAQAALALACARAYDAGFWYGEGVPDVPPYARALAVAAHERGIVDAAAALIGDLGAS